MDLIFGNLCSLFAMATDGLSTSRRTARGMLLIQCLSQLFYGASAIILKGYSSAVQNAVSIARNLLASSRRQSRAVEWLLAILAVVLGVAFNNLGLRGLLPVVANLEYTLAVFRFKDDERRLKVAFLVNDVMYAVFNGIILNFVGVAANIVVGVMTVSFLIKDKKKNA